MKKKMFTLSCASCNSVNKYINVILFVSLSFGSRQRWPVAFWNLSTISVGPLEPVLDSGGGYDSSTASSIILSSRVNLLSSWNGPEPFYTDPIRSCFSHELGIPTRIRRLTFSFLLLPRSSLSRSSQLSMILHQNSIAHQKQNFIDQNSKRDYYPRSSECLVRIRSFKITLLSNFDLTESSFEFAQESEWKKCVPFVRTNPFPLSSSISILASRRLIKYYLSPVTRQPSNRIKLISPPWILVSLPPRRKRRYLPPLPHSCPSPPVNSCFLLRSTLFDVSSSFILKHGCRFEI